MYKIIYSLLLIVSLTTISCTTTKQATRLPDPPAGFIPMEDNAPDKLPPITHEKLRLDIFSREDISKLQHGTVFLGDSITEGFPIQKYFTKELVINRGISAEGMGGFRGFGTYNRLESTVYNLHPKRIIMMIGVNDTPGMTPDNTQQKLLQYDYLVWKIRHDLPNTELWCISLLPTRDRHAYLLPSIRTFNIHAEEVAKKYNAHWLNVYPSFVDSNNEFIKEYTNDGLHPNTVGQDVLAKLYHEHIFKR